MRGWKGIVTITIMLFCVGLLTEAGVAFAKTKKVNMNLVGAKTLYKYPAALDKAKKVTVKSTKKSVVAVKYQKKKKHRRIILKAKKLGTVTVTVKCQMKNKKKKTYKYKITVKKVKKVTALDRAKKAFQIQNQYRKEKGVAPLEWSDELYQFCLYRLKASGFDGHKNLGRDTNAYFGLYAKYKILMFGENMHCGYSDPQSVMESWKKSSGHYKNLLSSGHVCGAIAAGNNTWCAIFFDKDKSEIENWRNYRIKEVKVKRYDNASGTYIAGSSIGYYEAKDRWGTQRAAAITDAAGKSLYLEVGKTYVIYERTTPGGYGKAERVTVTVTEDGDNQIVLTG